MVTDPLATAPPRRDRTLFALVVVLVVTALAGVVALLPTRPAAALRESTHTSTINGTDRSNTVFYDDPYYLNDHVQLDDPYWLANPSGDDFDDDDIPCAHGRCQDDAAAASSSSGSSQPPQQAGGTSTKLFFEIGAVAVVAAVCVYKGRKSLCGASGASGDEHTQPLLK